MLSRVWGTLRRRRLDQDLDEEVQEHLDMLVERFIHQGMTPEEARYAARRQFGGFTQLKEDLRERHGLPQIEILVRDVRYAFRQLWAAPSFTIAAVLTLAMGIGANTAVFAVVDAVVFRPLPFSEPDRLVSFQSRDTRGTPHPSTLSYPNFFDCRTNNHVFQHLVSYRDSEFTLAGSAEPIHVDGEIVSWDLFPLLRVQPLLGRGFLPDEEKPGTHVVVLSHGLWQSHFGGDLTVIGRLVTINGRPFTVVGVAPATFRFPVDNPAIQLWTTLAEDAIVSEFDPLTVQRGARLLNAIARLNNGVTINEARVQMDSVASSLAAEYPDDNKNIASTYVRPELDRLIGDTRRPMFILLGAVFLVLLIACANIANLVLARTVERERELAVRTAIGASPLTVIRQLLTESLVLALIGSLAGVLFALACLRLFLPLAGDSFPRISQANIDGRVLAFSIAAAVFTSVLFSLVPAIQVPKVDLISSLKEGTRGVARGHERLRGVLVVGQVSLGLVLLSGAALLIASFLYLERRDLGFRSDRLLTFSLGVPDAQYKIAKQIALSDQLLERLRVLPGAQSAAAGMPLPMAGNQMSVSFDIQERPASPSDRPHSDMAIVTPGYFSTLGIPLQGGRDFTERDDAQAPPVLIVNRAFAVRYFPGEDVIGKRIEPGATNGNTGTTMHEIVGLVGNAKQSALDLDPDPIYYFPYKQLSWGIGSVILRTSVPPRTIESAVRATISSLDKQIPMYQVRTMEELSSAAIDEPRFQMFLLGIFAVIALLLTVVGLYGILAYSVIKRTREIGVRIALGATRSAILTMVLKHAMRLVFLGLVIGLTGVALEGYLLQSMLYGIRPSDPLLLLLACCVIVITTMIAAYLPARRAASVDAMRALRTE
jgi:putative ABC transport system permease protein